MSDSLEESSSSVLAVLEVPAPKPQELRAQKAQTRTKQNPQYHVIIWNDDYHTPEYVIELLMTLFAHPLEAAEQISSAVDKTGKGVAYTCHQELAELKRDQILNYRPEFLGVDNLGPMWATIEPSPD